MGLKLNQLIFHCLILTEKFHCCCTLSLLRRFFRRHWPELPDIFLKRAKVFSIIANVQFTLITYGFIRNKPSSPSDNSRIRDLFTEFANLIHFGQKKSFAERHSLRQTDRQRHSNSSLDGLLYLANTFSFNSFLEH